LGHISLLPHLEAFTDNLRLPFDALNEMQITILLDLLGKDINILDEVALLHPATSPSIQQNQSHVSQTPGVTSSVVTTP
jgi:hypothetical protein